MGWVRSRGKLREGMKQFTDIFAWEEGPFTVCELPRINPQSSAHFEFLKIAPTILQPNYNRPTLDRVTFYIFIYFGENSVTLQWPEKKLKIFTLHNFLACTVKPV